MASVKEPSDQIGPSKKQAAGRRLRPGWLPWRPPRLEKTAHPRGFQEAVSQAAEAIHDRRLARGEAEGTGELGHRPREKSNRPEKAGAGIAPTSAAPAATPSQPTLASSSLGGSCGMVILKLSRWMPPKGAQGGSAFELSMGEPARLGEGAEDGAEDQLEAVREPNASARLLPPASSPSLTRGRSARALRRPETVKEQEEEVEASPPRDGLRSRCDRINLVSGGQPASPLSHEISREEASRRGPRWKEAAAGDGHGGGHMPGKGRGAFRGGKEFEPPTRTPAAS